MGELKIFENVFMYMCVCSKVNIGYVCMINLVQYVNKFVRNYQQIKQGSCKHTKDENTAIRNILSEEQRPKKS